MAKQRPKTGERRRTNLPLKIDRLPEPIQQAILVLRNQQGKSWQAIEEQSARPYSKDWEKDGGGFVEWESLPTEALEHFPDLKLPHTNMHRWYDLRVRQVYDQKLKDAERAHAWAERFTATTLKGSSEAVVNAMQAEVFNLMQNVSETDQRKFLGGLNTLALVMMRLRRLELQEKKVAADLAKSEADRARYAAEAGDPREIYLLAAQELLKKLRTYNNLRGPLDALQDELITELAGAADAFAKQIEAAA